MSAYDRVLARQYAGPERLLNPHALIPYRWLQDSIGEATDWLILDLACGSGNSSRILEALGANVYAIDSSDEMLVCAREQERKRVSTSTMRTITYELYDARFPQALAGTVFQGLTHGVLFDAVSAVFLINYAETYADLVHMMRTARINLRPGGKLFGVTEHPEHPVLPRVCGKSELLEWVDAPMCDGSRIRITLHDVRDNTICSFIFRHWSRQTVERAAHEASFHKFEWYEFNAELYRSLSLPEMLVESETRIGFITQ